MTSSAAKPDRLFVPLAGVPFDAFASGAKRWELRRHGRQWTGRHVRVGRRVELRRGYGAGRSLFGTVAEVVEAEGAAEFLSLVPFPLVLPWAPDLGAAVAAAAAYVGDTGGRLIGFRVDLDPDRPAVSP